LACCVSVVLCKEVLIIEEDWSFRLVVSEENC
jgi:hypothetical protein